MEANLEEVDLELTLFMAIREVSKLWRALLQGFTVHFTNCLSWFVSSYFGWLWLYCQETTTIQH